MVCSTPAATAMSLPDASTPATVPAVISTTGGDGPLMALAGTTAQCSLPALFEIAKTMAPVSVTAETETPDSCGFVKSGATTLANANVVNAVSNAEPTKLPESSSAAK